MQIPRRSVLLLMADQLAVLWFSSRLLPQDLFDSLASHVSAGVAMVLFTVIMARMNFKKSIECFVPPEWPGPWERAAEAYCYMEGAYAVPRVNLNKTGPDAWEVKVPQTYYYWLPIILIALAVILKMPDNIWSLYCDLSDLQPGQTLMAVNTLTESAKASARKSLSKLLGQHLIGRRESGRSDFSASRLFLAYLASKALRLVATLGSVVFLQRSFGLSNPLFGVAAWLRQSSPQDAGSVESFPTLTFCDVALRQLGGWNTRTVQCVLPINLLLDKVAIFLWFWLVTCGALCAGSAVVWLVRVGSESRRRRYAKTFVRFLRRHKELRLRRRQREREREQRLDQGAAPESPPATEPQQEERQRPPGSGDKDSPVEHSLIRAVSTVDRIFLVRLIQERLGMASAYLAMEAMVEHWLSQSDKERV